MVQASYEYEIKEEYLTTLVSPDYPDPYPPKTRKEWSFIIPPGSMGHIKVNILRVERFWDPLTLTLSSQSANGTNVITFPMVSSNVTSLLLPDGVVEIRFCSDEFLRHDGFAFEVTTLHVNGTDFTNASYDFESFAKAPDFMCHSGMQFIDGIARCDQVVDCHDFSDEIGCLIPDEECPYRCRDSDICLLDTYQCDGWFDCPERDDEDSCGKTAPSSASI
nr:transmembrane protease serine 7-like [Lytechinus pictus]